MPFCSTRFTSRHNMNRHLRDIHGKDKYLNDIGIVSNHVPITGQIIDLTDTKHEDDKVIPIFIPLMTT